MLNNPYKVGDRVAVVTSGGKPVRGTVLKTEGRLCECEFEDHRNKAIVKTTLDYEYLRPETALEEALFKH